MSSFFMLAKKLSLQALSPGFPNAEKLRCQWYWLTNFVTALAVYWLPRSLWKIHVSGKAHLWWACLSVAKTKSVSIWLDIWWRKLYYHFYAINRRCVWARKCPVLDQKSVWFVDDIAFLWRFALAKLSAKHNNHSLIRLTNAPTLPQKQRFPST